MDVILDAYEHVPPSVLREQRRQRPFISAVLARNEVDRDYAYNRHLFLRVRQGWYQLNPRMSVRARPGEAEGWTPIYTALNLPLVKEVFAEPAAWRAIDHLLVKDRYAAVGAPLAGARFLEQHQKTTGKG